MGPFNSRLSYLPSTVTAIFNLTFIFQTFSKANRFPFKSFCRHIFFPRYEDVECSFAFIVRGPAENPLWLCHLIKIIIILLNWHWLLFRIRIFPLFLTLCFVIFSVFRFFFCFTSIVKHYNVCEHLSCLHIQYFRTLNTRVSVVYVETWGGANQAQIDGNRDIGKAISNFNDYTSRNLFKIDKDTTQLLT